MAMNYTAPLIESARGAKRRGEELDAAMIERLRPHVINLRMGRFSKDGKMTTQREDVDAIFEEELPRFVAAHSGTGMGVRVPVVFYAHGGLVAESSGLAVAAKHLDSGSVMASIRSVSSGRLDSSRRSASCSSAP